MKKRKKKGGFLIRVGTMMVLCALLLTGYNFYDGYRAEQASKSILGPLEEMIAPVTEKSQGAASDVSFRIDTGMESGTALEQEAKDASETALSMAPAEIVIPDYVLNPDMEMPVSRHDGQDYIGILEIPALELKLPVISKWSYSRLKIAPCRYSGSAYTKDLVIAAHNYAAHFGGLKNLYEGAAVTFTDADGNVFHYRVEMLETLNPQAIDYMKESEWDLSLFTCTPGGSYRVTVRCNEARSGI